MKKILLLLAMLPLFFSCTLNDFGDDIQVVNTTVYARDWRAYATNGHIMYYSCTLNMPEITRNNFENGIVGVNFVTMSNYGGSTQYFQQPLPYLQHLTTQSINWTRYIDYDYSQGQLTLYVTNHDFFDEFPPNMDFRITIQH